MPHPDDEILSLIKRVTDLEEKVRHLYRAEVCEDCGVNVPTGMGLGFSAPEEEWVDRSKSRPMKMINLCKGCMVKRIFKKEA